MVIEADALRRCYALIPDHKCYLGNLKKRFIFSLSEIDGTPDEPYWQIERAIYDTKLLLPHTVNHTIHKTKKNSSIFRSIPDWHYLLLYLSNDTYSLELYPVAVKEPTRDNIVKVIFRSDYILNKYGKDRYPRQAKYIFNRLIMKGYSTGIMYLRRVERKYSPDNKIDVYRMEEA